jgi:hypothetical protein
MADEKTVKDLDDREKIRQRIRSQI